MTVLYNTALGVIFGVKKYAGRLLKVVEKRSVIDLLVSSMNTQPSVLNNNLTYIARLTIN